VEADGTLTLVAGVPGHGVADGSAGSVTGFDSVAGPTIDADPAGNLWILLPPYLGNGGGAATVLGYFAADATGTVGPASLFHWVGKGGSIGAEYVDQSLIQFQQASDIAVRAHAWVVEAASTASSIRLVW
jgi:hypothetical protein